MSHDKVKEIQNESCLRTCCWKLWSRLHLQSVVSSRLTMSITEPIWTKYLCPTHVICTWKRILFWSIAYGGASCEHSWFGSSCASTLLIKEIWISDQFIEWVSDHVQIDWFTDIRFVWIWIAIFRYMFLKMESLTTVRTWLMLGLYDFN